MTWTTKTGTIFSGILYIGSFWKLLCILILFSHSQWSSRSISVWCWQSQLSGLKQAGAQPVRCSHSGDQYFQGLWGKMWLLCCLEILGRGLRWKRFSSNVHHRRYWSMYSTKEKELEEMITHIHIMITHIHPNITPKGHKVPPSPSPRWLCDVCANQCCQIGPDFPPNLEPLVPTCFS